MAQEFKQKPTQRKGSSNNLPGTEDDPKKRPRFSIYWVYGILLACLLGYNFIKGANSAGIETNIETFKDFVKEGDVTEIKIIRNKKIVRVSLNKDDWKG